MQISLDESTKNKIKGVLEFIGYDHRHWTRPVMYETCHDWINGLDPKTLDTMEISAGKAFQDIEFLSYESLDYPDFDICESKSEKMYDLIIADQVWEHLLYPYRATQNVLSMLKPGGHFLVTTPFLIKVHPIPYDCTRWTETGMRYFLSEAGFPLELIKTDSWGNRACVKANFKKWARRGWLKSLKNEPDFPVVVWALAQKPL